MAHTVSKVSTAGTSALPAKGKGVLVEAPWIENKTGKGEASVSTPPSPHRDTTPTSPLLSQKCRISCVNQAIIPDEEVGKQPLQRLSHDRGKCCRTLTTQFADATREGEVDAPAVSHQTAVMSNCSGLSVLETTSLLTGLFSNILDMLSMPAKSPVVRLPSMTSPSAFVLFQSPTSVKCPSKNSLSVFGFPENTLKTGNLSSTQAPMPPLPPPHTLNDARASKSGLTSVVNCVTDSARTLTPTIDQPHLANHSPVSRPGGMNMDASITGYSNSCTPAIILPTLQTQSSRDASSPHQDPPPDAAPL
ncbi:hypothetical protein GYMLUDRAFT_244142 [Collybiopsis luxurians FD-317 M1]|uniref:Uncharacterized protein n=1 Tax=Collybiopsis luxurians FD-317 M1 TaxID=944289 RepID=A0A0D0CDM0_9AGAR|nr:hypothetical protein GYMLUDRAFT_244142 [Collybiopsis luxurians FD-317 M1]